MIAYVATVIALRVGRVLVRRHRGLTFQAEAPLRGFLRADRRDVVSGEREAESRHVAVDALVLAGGDDVCLVPDADAAAGADRAVEALPRLEMACRRIAREALELLEVDEAGLERLDRELLRAIAEKYGGGPVGLNTLAAALGEEPDTIEYVYEPYLLQLGFIARTPRGRTITAIGRAHLGSAPEPETRLF